MLGIVGSFEQEFKSFVEVTQYGAMWMYAYAYSGFSFFVWRFAPPGQNAIHKEKKYHAAAGSNRFYVKERP